MRPRILLFSLLLLGACSSPEPRKQVDPDVWDPRHQALLDEEDPPEPWRAPRTTRLSRSGSAAASLSESDGEHATGIKGLREATEEQDAAAARLKEREAADHQQELRRTDRERAGYQATHAQKLARVRLALLCERQLGIACELVLAYGAGRGELRQVARFAEARASELERKSLELDERASKAARDAALQRRLLATGTVRPHASLKAQRRAQAHQLAALRAEEAALRAREGASRWRREFF